MGLGKWLLFSGGFGTGPHSGANLLGWTSPEAEVFAEEAVRCGMSRGSILVESCARNTGENVTLSRQLLEEQGLPLPKLVVVVQKPFMERRTYATFKKVWAGSSAPDIIVSSPSTSWEDYPEACGIPRETILQIMVGDLQRLRLYSVPPRDFQIPVDVPDDVWASFELLVGAGFTQNLVPEAP